ncbi:hypothetical protein G6F65_021864 [Rhizopus arrhizus]|nr:hypothetical protein G6F65_021864 [Rhizopus arrhizus]
MTGQSASFLAGGELPIPEAGGLGTVSVTFKPFGIGLTVTPTVLSRDRISLKVAPEASELDYSNGIVLNSGTDSSSIIPALRTRRADTTVELGDGESFVISGLVSRQTKAMVSKVPLLGRNGIGDRGDAAACPPHRTRGDFAAAGRKARACGQRL